MKALLCNTGFLAFILFGSVKIGGACGIDWVLPTNHFDGVNELGNLSYWKEIGVVDFGDDLKIPLVINFNPTRGASPYLGKGWTFALLESNIVQVDERRFLLTQPDGITRQFWRKNPTDTILKGQGNWRGEINGAAITLWADCGWKLTFKNGKNTSISNPKNRVLNLIYAGGKVSEIQEHGKTMLKVDSEPGSGKVTGLTYGNDHIGIELGDKPRVDVAQGLNVVGGMEQSLHKLLLPNGTLAIYDFAVNDLLQPTLKISGDSSRLFSWDTATGQALKDGEWVYNITAGSDPFKNAQIGRTNDKKQSEYWFEDKTNGEELIANISGYKSSRRWFVSGPTNDRPRDKRVWDEKGTLTSQISYSYDAAGRLIRERRNELLLTYNNQTLTQVKKGNVTIWDILQ